MKPPLICCVLILPAFIFSGSIISVDQNVKEKTRQTDSVDTTICITCPGATLAAPEFSEISGEEFDRFRKNYHNPLQIDSSKIRLGDSSFSLTTKRSKLTFNTEYNQNFGNRRGFSWYNYMGYNKDLNVYVLEQWWECEFTLGESFMIDRTNNIKYTFSSLLDGPNFPPVISPGAKFMISYNNDNTNPEGFCRLDIVKVNRSKGKISYESYVHFESTEWSITELVWIDDISFCIKTNSQTYDEDSSTWIDHFRYFKTPI